MIKIKTDHGSLVQSNWSNLKTFSFFSSSRLSILCVDGNSGMAENRYLVSSKMIMEDYHTVYIFVNYGIGGWILRDFYWTWLAAGERESGFREGKCDIKCDICVPPWSHSGCQDSRLMRGDDGDGGNSDCLRARVRQLDSPTVISSTISTFYNFQLVLKHRNIENCTAYAF